MGREAPIAFDLMDLPSRAAITRRLRETLEPMVAGAFGDMPVPAAIVRPHLDALVTKGENTVRDGILTLLAMEIEHGKPIDWHTQTLYSPARAASRDLGAKIYRELHISGSKESLQTGVKGVGRYMDRRNRTWKAVLEWAADEGGGAGPSDIEPVRQAFLYLAACVAETARDLPGMPALDTPRLTFPAVFEVLDEMLGQRSGGAHEQFVFAALLEAWHGQLGELGVIDTKNLNASDASARTAADVQEKHKGEVKQAYEVTADSYTVKVGQAVEMLRRHDLRRAHIVARDVVKVRGKEIAATLPEGADLSILDVREESRSLLARLDKPHRRSALERLYEMLVDKQPKDSLVRSYVALLEKHALTEAS
jgi:hypothetical protein